MRRQVLIPFIGAFAVLTADPRAAFRDAAGVRQAEPAPGTAPDGPDAAASATRGGASVVRLDATVTDHEGKPVPGLTPADFEVRVDGALQAIDGIEAGTAGLAMSMPGARRSPIESALDEQREAQRSGARLYAIFLDEYHVSPGSATLRVRDGVARFIDELVGPDDLAVVMKPLDPLFSIRLTRDRDALREAARSFAGRKGDFAPRTPFEEGFLSRVPAAIEAVRAQLVLSALHALAAHAGGLREGRKALVFVSEGFAHEAPAGGGRLPDVRSIVRTANQLGVTIYALNPGAGQPGPAAGGSVPEPAVDRGRADATLAALAGQTAGEVIAGTDTIEGGFRRIARDLDASYLLTCRPPHANDGKFHTVQVRVTRPGVQVRSRAGYWAPGAGQAGDPGSSLPAQSPPSLGPFRPLRQSPLVRPWFGMARGAGGLTRVSVTWEAGRTAAAGWQRAAPAAVVLSATTGDGKPLFRGRIAPVRAGGAGALPERAVFEAAPGRVDVDMTVEAADGRVLDSDARVIEVANLSGAGPVIGTPEILRTRTAREFLAAVADADAPPVVSREFSRSERLLVRVPAYGSAGKGPAVTARLLSRPGRPIRELPAMPAPTRHGATQFDLPLAGLAFGEYTLELTAADDAGRVSTVVMFRVTS